VKQWWSDNRRWVMLSGYVFMALSTIADLIEGLIDFFGGG